ncbi:TetR/AcrR family transcriptional regulator [Gordonia aurantiaca]|uniref:TetR/AcrR family transcriptional regulator n=1 Tax=Gordonia sp. B21 TaxID=3151852 RepID=UPI003264A5B1
MEKSSGRPTRQTLLDAGIELIGSLGERQASTRAVEDAAGVPHGSIRHHFGGRAGFLAALVEHVFTLDVPASGESPRDAIVRWLGPDRTRTRARYELLLLATRDDELRARMVAGRDRFVTRLVDAGMAASAAQQLVAALDGLVLDALLRDSDGTGDAHDPGRLLGALG